MALITKPNTFTVGATIIASEHNDNFDTVYNEFNGNINNANIKAGAGIVDTKLAQITTPSKISGAALTSISSIPSGAGNLPSANMSDKVVLSATDTATELTISSGSVTATQSYHTIDTESDAASDDLDTISGGIEGMVLIIRAINSARSVVVKDGTGNIECAGDFTMDNAQDTITLVYDDTLDDWFEISRSNNGA